MLTLSNKGYFLSIILTLLRGSFLEMVVLTILREQKLLAIPSVRDRVDGIFNLMLMKTRQRGIEVQFGFIL